MNTSNSISHLLKDYFQEKNSHKTTLIESSSLPIVANSCNWEVHQDPERFSRKFKFKNRDEVKHFIELCLTYERHLNHLGEYRISDLSVTVEVYTHDVNRITNLDQEFIKNIDFIYEDVLSFES